MEQLYFNIKEASEMLRISETTIYRKIRAGLIPKANYCGKVLIPSWFFKEALYKDFVISDKEKKEW